MNFRYMPHLATAVVAIALLGCTTVEQVMQEQVAAIPEAQRAYIVGTFRVECVAKGNKCYPSFNSLSTFYRNASDKSIRGTLNVAEGGFGGSTVYDFVDVERKEKGIFFCQSIPAGDYSIYSYNYYNYDGGGNGYNLSEENQFNVPFHANAGEITYIGDIKQTYELGKSLVGLKMIAPGVIELSPGTSGDAQSAVAKCPASVRGLPLLSQPLKGAVGGSPLVVVKAAN